MTFFFFENEALVKPDFATKARSFRCRTALVEGGGRFSWSCLDEDGVSLVGMVCSNYRSIRKINEPWWKSTFSVVCTDQRRKNCVRRTHETGLWSTTDKQMLKGGQESRKWLSGTGLFKRTVPVAEEPIDRCHEEITRKKDQSPQTSTLSFYGT